MLFSQYLDMMDSACKGTTLFLYDKILAQKIAAELRSCPSDVRCTCGAVQCAEARFNAAELRFNAAELRFNAAELRVKRRSRCLKCKALRACKEPEARARRRGRGFKFQV